MLCYMYDVCMHTVITITDYRLRTGTVSYSLYRSYTQLHVTCYMYICTLHPGRTESIIQTGYLCHMHHATIEAGKHRHLHHRHLLLLYAIIVIINHHASRVSHAINHHRQRQQQQQVHQLAATGYLQSCV